MSIEAMAWALDAPVKTPEQRLAMILLGDSADEVNMAFPNIDRWVRLMCLNHNELRRLFREMEDLQLIAKILAPDESPNAGKIGLMVMIPDDWTGHPYTKDLPEVL